MGSRMTIALLVVSVVLWATNFNLAKPALAEMHPLVVGAARFAVAAAVMVVIAMMRRQHIPLRRHGRSYLALGAVGIASFNVLFFFGMQDTTPINASLIMATNPLVTALLAALFLKEKPSRRQMLALPVALIGVASVLLGGGAGGLALSPGDTLILGGNLCWAAYNVMVRRIMPMGSGVANTAGVMICGAVMLCVLAGASGAPLTMPGPKALAAVLVMGVFGTVMGYLFYNAALVRLGAGKTALFLNLVPVVAMTISGLTGHPPTVLQVAGALVTIGAVTVAMLPARRPAAA